MIARWRLAPGVPALKQWAFAGLTFGLPGVLPSPLAVGDGPSVWTPALVAAVLVTCSSIAYGRTAMADQRAAPGPDVTPRGES